MKAFQLSQLTEKLTPLEAEVQQPQVGAGDVLIRVHAAGVTPTELLWYPTSHTKSGEARLAAVPGHEFSGTVAALGENVDGFEIGQEVYGMNDWFADGALAEYCVTVPESIAPKPERLSHIEAASVPIGALTAWQGLIERAKLLQGERELIHGGAGAVGIFAIQLARHCGAHVITTVSARNAEFAAKLGADQVIDYHTTRFESVARDIDVVFDAVGGETLERSWQVLNTGGRMVTIAADVEGTTDERKKKAFFIVEPNALQLEKISQLLDDSVIVPVVDAVVPFANAPDAYTGELKTGLGRGKVVVAVAPA
jgi:NADPH:quinone reductase-like Zn-dependent oxidoreductase